MMRSRSLLFVLALAMPACVVHGRAGMSVETTPVEVYQEPPPPQVETVEARPGYVFIHGRWDWRGGQWVWIGGHWERERTGFIYAEGRWENRGGRWVWNEGTWNANNSAPPPNVNNASGGVMVSGGAPAPQPMPQPQPMPTNTASGGVSVSGGVTVSAYPTAAPPPPRNETWQPRAGFVFIAGHWDWRGGQWAWIDGHWERARTNATWAPGRWENQGGRWMWVEGSWQAQAATPSPVVRDHRTH